MLMLLLGLSLPTFGAMALYQAIVPDPYIQRIIEARQLNQTRQRLIHYSVDYANLYGAGGAGPGHLPCPDTDAMNVQSGPNPPCSQQIIASGKVPSGVTRTIGRLGFTHQLSNRPIYEVGRALVNNPMQAIATNQWPDEHRFSSHTFAYAKLTGVNGESRTIGKKHLQVPVHQWVQAWLVNQLLISVLSHCEKRSYEDVQIDSSPIVLADCALAEPATRRIPIACRSEVTVCVLEAEELLSLLTNGDQLDWQGVPIRRHWFVANQWLALAQLQLHTDCAFQRQPCVLAVVPDSKNLRLQWLVFGGTLKPGSETP